MLPSAGAGRPFYFVTAALPADHYDVNSPPQGRISPFYVLADNLSIIRGNHQFKAGFEGRLAITNGFNSFRVISEYTLGSGGAPIQGLTVPGLVGNLTLAQNILNDITGSVGTARQQFNSPGGKNPQFVGGEFNQRTWQQREFSFFFKDDWRVNDRLTLNLGLRYEFYGVPYERNGKSAILAGGSGSIFGLSGAGNVFRPGVLTGQMSAYELVGRTTNNPGVPLYERDYNNFAPAIGITVRLPGSRTTLFRAGYMVVYDRNLLRNVDIYAGDVPGLNTVESFTPSVFTSSGNVPVLRPAAVPLTPIALNDRLQTLRTYDTKVRTPYNQNFNAGLQHEITRDMVISARWVATKGTKLLRGININEFNVFENGVLEAFQITQRGGNAPLFDRIFNGLMVPGRGAVNGTTIKGSDYARTNGTFGPLLANNQAGVFAQQLNESAIPGARGGFLTRAGLPENFIVANPQVRIANLLGNFSNFTFHSLQVELERRFAAGFTFQGNYTFAKALGDEEGDTQQLEDQFRTLRNRSLDKRILDFSRRHALKINGVWELPFGRKHRLLSNAGPVLNHLVGGWQVSGFLLAQSGQPMDVNALLATLNGINADNTPTVVGNVSRSLSKLTKLGNGVTLFPGMQVVNDPGRQNLSADLRAQSRMFGIADAQGNLLLRNPDAGTLGNLGSTFFQGPGRFNVDLSLQKNFQVTERIGVVLRGDFINATNTPWFANPAAASLDINSQSFGRITAMNAAYSPREVVLSARVNF